MKRVIAFTKLRYLMLGVSALVILAGVVGVVLQGGLNLGIDFKGGLTQQVQILPVALSLTYDGEGTADLAISSAGVLELTLFDRETEKRETLTFDFETYPTLGILTDLLNRVDGVQGEASLASETATMRLFPVEPEVALSEQPYSINIRMGDDEDLIAPIEDVRDALSELENYTIQVVGNPRNQEFIVRVEIAGDDEEFQVAMEEKINELLSRRFGYSTVILKKSDFVGPRFSQDLAKQTFSLTAVALALILIYISFRFRVIFAVAAILALVHDVAVTIGIIGILQLEVTTAIIAAVLTIIGYSLNDTIVIFDRIRENQTLLRDSNLETIVNTSVTQSLSRTLVTSLTTLLAVTAIYVFGTGEIQSFALSMIIGVIVGTYSSIFIASPVVLGWQLAMDSRRKTREARKYGSRQAEPPAPVRKASERSTEEQPTTDTDATDKPAISPPSPSVQQRRPRKKKKKKK